MRALSSGWMWSAQNVGSPRNDRASYPVTSFTFSPMNVAR
jgi:hypothetical protein